MSNSGGKERLRLMTYLCPGIGVEVYETLLQYLEEVTGRDAYLIYESRWSGPPPDRQDLFTSDEVDIGFMCGSFFLRLVQEQNKYIELCEAAPLFLHPKNESRPVYFSDVIVHAENKKKYKEFHDLRGHKWAYNEATSMSGNLVVLAHLKKMGFNSTFFGNIMETGSHLSSLKMVLEKTVDAAAIDANVLQSYLSQHPEKKTEIHILQSMGPMPIYPVVFNSRLPSELKKKITSALLDMNKKPEWNRKLSSLNMGGFLPCDMSLYNLEKDIIDLVKGLSIKTAYY